MLKLPMSGGGERHHKPVPKTARLLHILLGASTTFSTLASCLLSTRLTYPGCWGWVGNMRLGWNKRWTWTWTWVVASPRLVLAPVTACSRSHLTRKTLLGFFMFALTYIMNASEDHFLIPSVSPTGLHILLQTPFAAICYPNATQISPSPAPSSLPFFLLHMLSIAAISLLKHRVACPRVHTFHPPQPNTSSAASYWQRDSPCSPSLLPQSCTPP